MKNIGKVLEAEFKASIPTTYFYYRLRDSAGAWSGGENTRFTPTNICDCIVYGKGILTLIELKNTYNASLPLNNIKPSQLKGLSEINTEGVQAYFFICFRAKERSFLVDAKKVKAFEETGARKSIPLKWCEDEGIEIKMTKKKVKYKYDLSTVFGEV